MAELRHGLSGYSNHGCRCGVCVAAKREYARGYRDRNRVQLRQDALDRYYRIMAENPDRIRSLRRAYAKTPKGIIANRMARHKRRGASPDALAREYAAILLSDPCSYCGEPAVELDHIDPLSDAGLGTWENLTGACRPCNARKNDRRLLAFVAT